MKELSIEEKAKRYDEAIERAEGVIEQNPLMEYLKKGIEYILPELKESEDEKIRKELIEFVKSRGGFKQEYIAWLERQGEHANFRNKIQIGDKVTRNEDGVLVNLSQLKRVAKKDEKQGEQKPVWSQEDEDILNTIINHFKIDIECTDEDDIVRWLKSLKGRVQPQPKQEWSLKEDAFIQVCVNAINDISYFRSEDKEELINWLKSLSPQNNITDEELAQAKKDAYNDALDKIEYHSGEPTFDDGWSAAIWFLKKRNIAPQNTWKPSDEQMKILNEVLNFAANHESPHWNDYIFGTLNNLIRQLKKL